LDWGIRGNWLWSVFPSTWKAVIVSIGVGGIGALIAIISKAGAMHGWIAFLLSVFLYVVMWAIVQKTGCPALRYCLALPCHLRNAVLRSRNSHVGRAVSTNCRLLHSSAHSYRLKVEQTHCAD